AVAAEACLNPEMPDERIRRCNPAPLGSGRHLGYDVAVHLRGIEQPEPPRHEPRRTVLICRVDRRVLVDLAKAFPEHGEGAAFLFAYLCPDLAPLLVSSP